MSAIVRDGFDGKDAPIEGLGHPQGHYGFDTRDDERSREIIARTLAFMKYHLST